MPGMARGTMTDEYRRARNNFYMDLENYVLEHVWRAPAPVGPARHLFNSGWGRVMRAELADYDASITFVDYGSWVEQGGGDEWFQSQADEEPLPVNGHRASADDLRRLGQAGG